MSVVAKMCPKCKKRYELSKQYCGICGKQLKRVCECGEILEDDSLFCQSCGAKVTTASTVKNGKSRSIEEMLEEMKKAVMEMESVAETMHEKKKELDAPKSALDELYNIMGR